jgi:hypothetical protein
MKKLGARNLADLAKILGIRDAQRDLGEWQLNDQHNGHHTLERLLKNPKLGQSRKCANFCCES